MGAMQFANPLLGSSFDADPQAAAEQRLRIFNIAGDSHCWVAGGHLSFPGIGHIRAAQTIFAWWLARRRASSCIRRLRWPGFLSGGTTGRTVKHRARPVKLQLAAHDDLEGPGNGPSRSHDECCGNGSQQPQDSIGIEPDLQTTLASIDEDQLVRKRLYLDRRRK